MWTCEIIDVELLDLFSYGRKLLHMFSWFGWMNFIHDEPTPSIYIAGVNLNHKKQTHSI